MRTGHQVDDTEILRYALDDKLDRVFILLQGSRVQRFNVNLNHGSDA